MHTRITVVMVIAGLLLAGCSANPMVRGDRKFAEGEYVEAIREYGLVLEKGENADAALRRACAFKMMGHDEAAEGDLIRAARAGSVEARAMLAAIRGAADMTVFDKLTRQYPDSPWVWALYGDCLLQAGDSEKAVKAYEQALAKGLTGPMATSVLYNLALAHVCTGDPTAAETRFEQYRTVNDSPPSAADHYLAGLLAYARGDRETAGAEWRAMPEQWRDRIGDALPGEERIVAAE